ncbi:MAG TPA: hypothetical protein VID72_11155 [Ktedonobacterales bacterium]
MNTPILESPPVSQMLEEPHSTDTDAAWRPIYRAGGVAALLTVMTVVIAIPVFIVSPPPTTVAEWFALLHRNGVVGLIDLDLVMMAGIGLSGLIYLALFGALRRVNQPVLALAAIVGYVSIATYFASNVAFNMLLLSDKYATATSEAERSQLLAAGQAALATWQGSAYDVSYVLGGVAILIFSAVMLRSAIFGKATAYLGLLFGLMMLAPATAGTVGIILAFASLLPMVVWEILIARRLFQLAAHTR